MPSLTWTNPRVLLMRKTKKALESRCKARGIPLPDKFDKTALVDLLCPPEKARAETNDLLKALGVNERL